MSERLKRLGNYLDTFPIITYPLAYVDRKLFQLRTEQPQPQGSLRLAERWSDLALLAAGGLVALAGFRTYLNAPPPNLDSYPDKTYYASTLIEGKDVIKKQPVLTFNQGLITTTSKEGLVAPTFAVRVNIEELNRALADPNNNIRLPDYMAPIIVFTDQTLKFKGDAGYQRVQTQATQLLNDGGYLGDFRRQHPQEAFPPVVISVLDQLGDTIEGYQIRGDRQHEPSFYRDQVNSMLSARVFAALFKEAEGRTFDPLKTNQAASALASKYNPFQITHASPELFGMLPRG